MRLRCPQPNGPSSCIQNCNNIWTGGPARDNNPEQQWLGPILGPSKPAPFTFPRVVGDGRPIWVTDLTNPKRPVVSDLPATSGTGMGEPSLARMVWRGEERLVSAGHWIVAMDGLPGDASQQLMAGAQAIEHRIGNSGRGGYERRLANAFRAG